MAKLFANSGDLDQTLCSVASDLGLHCLPDTLLRVSRPQWVKKKKNSYSQNKTCYVVCCCHWAGKNFVIVKKNENDQTFIAGFFLRIFTKNGNSREKKAINK